MEEEKLILFDTTLRDGEQSPGFHMYPDEKFVIAKNLRDLGIDVLEAGNPVSSEGDYNAVRKIATEIEGITTAALARCVTKDIERAGKAIAPAVKRDEGRIHVYIGTSDVHTEKKLRKTREQVKKMAIGATKKALEYTDDVEFSCEDFGRTDPDYTIDIVSGVVDAGATTINLPDTVGYRLPQEIEKMVRYTINGVKNNTGKDPIYSIHCHDDLGLASANTLAAILGGVRQIEGTINGIGERAGNTALEETITAIIERDDFFDVYVDIDTTKIFLVSNMVSEFTGNKPQKNKAIVGDNAFTHEAGVHQDGMTKDRETYEWIKPENYGRQSKLTFGARSGRKGLREAYKNLGLEFEKDEFKQITDRFKKIADSQKEIDDSHLVMAAKDDEKVPKFYKIAFFNSRTTQDTAKAEISLQYNGMLSDAKCKGTGMIDALAKAINKITGLAIDIQRYESKSATPGSEAEGMEYMTLTNNGITVNGQGIDTDTVRGAAKAYIDGINRMKYVKDYLE